MANNGLIWPALHASFPRAVEVRILGFYESGGPPVAESQQTAHRR
jgi:hypothetical protein